jgi:hypothetical protein
MKVRALRGVCVGPERHLAPGETADLDAASVPFLVSIQAVEVVADDPPPAAEAQPEPKSPPAKKPGKKE